MGWLHCDDLHKFPGVGNLSKLPSGTAQLQQLRKPLVAKLWVEKNPDKLGLNYDDPVAVNEEIPHNWWLVDNSCKYILSVLVHKDKNPLFNIRHLFLMIPKVHSTSLRTLSMFVEKYPSGDETLVRVNGQIVVGQRKYPLSDMRYIPVSRRTCPS